MSQENKQNHKHGHKHGSGHKHSHGHKHNHGHSHKHKKSHSKKGNKEQKPILKDEQPEKIGEYQVGGVLGKGAFGVVYKGMHLETGEFVAIKGIPLKNIPKKELEDVMLEIKLLKKLKNRYIVKYMGSEKTNTHLYIFLEFIESGSLQQNLKKFGKFPEKLVAIYIEQTLKGLVYLHDQGVVHRDIKGANILTTKGSNIKLTDFGVSANLGEEVGDNSALGTPYWMAPEVIELLPTTTSCDIWSLGCTVIELITGQPPYFELSPMQAIYKIVQEDRPPLPENISPNLKNFLEQCFQKNPSLRVTAKNLLKHPWVRLVQQRRELSKKKQLTISKKDLKKNSSLSSQLKPQKLNNYGGSKLKGKGHLIANQNQNNNNNNKGGKKRTGQSRYIKPEQAENAEMLISSKKRKNALKKFQEKDDDDDFSDDFDIGESEDDSGSGSGSNSDNEGGGIKNPLSLSAKFNAKFRDRKTQTKSFDLRQEQEFEEDLYKFDEEDEDENLFDDLDDDDDDFFGDSDGSFDLENYNKKSKNNEEEDNTKLSKEVMKLIGLLQPKSEPEIILETCEKLMEIFGKHPEIKKELITHHGVIPILDMLDVSNPDVLHSTLKVVNQIIKDNQIIKENLCHLGSIPVIMKFARFEYIDPIRYQASLFLHEMCSTNRDTLKFFLGCGGLSVIVDLLTTEVRASIQGKVDEGRKGKASFTNKKNNKKTRRQSKRELQTQREFTQKRRKIHKTLTFEQKEMYLTAIKMIEIVFKVQMKTPKSYYIRLLTKSGVLIPLADMLCTFINLEKELIKLNGGKKNENGNDLNEDQDEDEEEKKRGNEKEKQKTKKELEIEKIQENILNVANMIISFAKAGSFVKIQMSDPKFLTIIFDTLTTSEPEILEKVLVMLKHVSMEPQSLDNFQEMRLIPKLIQILQQFDDQVSNRIIERIQTEVLHTVLDFCRFKKERQEEVAGSGIIPFLIKFINNDAQSKQLSLQILCDLAKSSKKARKELMKCDGINFFFDLLSMNYWRIHALEAISFWVKNERERVENVFLKTDNVKILIQIFSATSNSTIGNLLISFLRILNYSKKISRTLSNTSFVNELIKRFKHRDAQVRIGLLKVLKSLYTYNQNPKLMIRRFDLYTSIYSLKSDQAVIVQDFVDRILRAFHTNMVI
ncbi:mtk1/mekk4 [Anaeramoeba flamelloides]|uniref:non-specific serine/threonine protein kinase n=1 Tax=Anaeramoeba flamelloides TaxID=1746091 RepID=A0ABQ8XZZ6_9EUKA|nr:mtk1/mekk4 [Anaeramoeba flamelloides]